MMRILLIFAIFGIHMLFGAYDIKLGVFANVKNLRANIVKVRPVVFRHKIIVQKKNKLYYTHAIIPGSGVQAAKALKSYKRIFPDAFISGEVKEHHRKRKVVKKRRAVKKVKETDKTENYPILKATEISPKEKLLAIDSLLEGKTIYLCYADGPSHLDNRIVAMTFNGKTITYTPLEKKSTVEIPYTIEKNKVLLDVADTQMIHKVIENRKTYLDVESYIGTKKMHHLRYYFIVKDAIAYLKHK